GQRITLTQRDIRELQLGTGAIRAGVNILLKRASLAAGDLDAVLIAGGFGSYIRRSMAQRIGLLPGDIPHNRIKYIGNASLNGARWALLSTKVRAEAESVARTAQHVELSQDIEFQSEFAQAMIFPDEPVVTDN
ncbi:MAG: ATP-binding protein, partial [bacterium]|nr:ATP-binding protein [bacterium]